AEKLLLFQTYIPELANYPLESHSLCQTHYNQIVLSNLFYEHLSSLAQETQLGTNMDTQTTSYTDLANKLNRTKKLLEKEQANEAEELKKQLQQTREEFEKNKTLTEQWNSRFSTRQNHIDAIIEIANAERKALFDDIY
ncbi:35091_t:CDS:2, partial [Gigaspora margarita]